MAAMVDASQAESLLLSSTREGVETEKCVVAQHRTSIQQRDVLVEHITSCSSDRIPVEWVIDIADEKNGWFYGTAYHFDDSTRKLHVMIPDKHNPTFDGHIELDYRTVHLVECVDGKTDALFNKIIRDSIIKIRWELKWFEEDADDDEVPTPNEDDANAQGRWVASVGRYFIRIANQLLVEDEEVDGEKGFVMITADVNVRLHHCGKGRGQEDFNRLVLENQVQSTPAALEEANIPLSITDRVPSSAHSNGATADRRAGRRDRRGEYDPNTPSGRNDEINNELALGLNKVWDMSKDLKECVSELLDEKEKEKDSLASMAQSFSSFTMDGDLDAGLRLHVQCEEITVKQETIKHLKGREEREANEDALGQEAWHLMQRVEKGLNKLVRATAPLNGEQSAQQAAANAASVAEMELIKRRERKLRKDLEIREKELNVLKSAVK
jgi:hypothetical protein